MYFAAASIAVLCLIWLIVKIKLTIAEQMFIGVWSVAFQLSITIYLDIKYDLYGYFGPGVDWNFLIIVATMFPLSGILFINYVPYDKGWLARIIYIVMIAALSTFYEWIALHTEFLYHNQWKLRYSFIVYIVLFFANTIVFQLFKKYNNQSRAD